MTSSATAPSIDIRILYALADLVERALARLARLDPGSRDTLARLEGQTLRLSIRGAARGLRMRVADGRIRPVPDDPSPADLALSFEPSALVAWLAKARTDGGLPSSVRIEGDLELARVVERAVSEFDPDWEMPFVDTFGSTLGPQLARGIAGTVAWGRRQAAEFVASAAEFATEESQVVAARSEIDEFNGEVDRLRDDVERLAARLDRLTRTGGVA
jgi:ubiquinone biosynthesis protein UbiJ